MQIYRTFFSPILYVTPKNDKKNRSILLFSIYFLVVIVVIVVLIVDIAVEKRRCLYIYKKDKILSLFKVKTNYT